MSTAGLRELRQNASELVRQVEAGHTVTITVSGRPVAELVPPQRHRWRAWADIATIFAGPGDPTWAQDRDLVEDEVRNPWTET
jgi:prevent-host-death family protein